MIAWVRGSEEVGVELFGCYVILWYLGSVGYEHDFVAFKGAFLIQDSGHCVTHCSLPL